ncbi:hypothetical protein KDH_74150 [Dictyobacter sp. S3.2.2.5]|uniref:Tetratricopeptide repeat protein n=1 Tax=Dictyobacter halimunensis TaxID=3026934 RepID=A0ABQ6G245_9CHLR|nr:hypothetical protein KDH_74150 [Dictyobacter sp. S3.2.2.5]
MDVTNLMSLVGIFILVIALFIFILRRVSYALIVRHRKYRWAINYYSVLLVFFPFSATLYAWRSYAWLCLRDFERTLDDCARAIKRNDKMAIVYNYQATAYMGLYKFLDAYWAAQRAIQLNNILWAAYSNRACALQGLKDYGSAIKDFDLCIQQQPGTSGLYYGRANCYLRLQQYERAVQDYGSCIKLNANAWNAYHNRAYAYIGINDVEHGYADICKSCELHPSGLIHRLTKAWFELCLDPRLTPERVEDFAALSALETPQVSWRYSYQGMLAWMRGEYEQALEQFGLSIESSSFDDESDYFWSGMSLAALGRYEEARKAIDYALQHSLLPFLLKTLTLLQEEHSAFVEQYL